MYRLWVDSKILIFLYDEITYSTVECGMFGLSASISDVLPVIYLY